MRTSSSSNCSNVISHLHSVAEKLLICQFDLNNNHSLTITMKVARHVRIIDRIRQLRNKIKKIDDVVVFIVYCQYGEVRQYKRRRIYLGFFFLLSQE
jgi:hypothetical protein